MAPSCQKSSAVPIPVSRQTVSRSTADGSCPVLAAESEVRTEAVGGCLLLCTDSGGQNSLKGASLGPMGTLEYSARVSKTTLIIGVKNSDHNLAKIKWPILYWAETCVMLSGYGGTVGSSRHCK